MRRLGRARLVKQQTDDELVSVNDGVPLGREYVVDLNSRQRHKLFNVPSGRFHEKEMIEAVDGDEWAWYAAELLEIRESPLTTTDGVVRLPGGGDK